MTMTLSCRDDASNHRAVGLGSIRVHHSKRDAVGHTDGDDAALAVVTAGVFSFQRAPLENLRGEFVVESAICQIPVALATVPTEAHSVSIRLYIRRAKSRWPVLSGQRPAAAA